MAVDVTAPHGRAMQLAVTLDTSRTMDASRERIDLAGTRVDLVDFSTSVQRIRGFLNAPGGHQIVTVNLDFLAIAASDPEFRDTINMADLAVADGMPLVWVSRLKNQPLPARITGDELVEECCRIGAETDASVFLLGAADGIAPVAADVLEERFPGLRVAGTFSPPFGPLSQAENERIIRKINASAPASCS